MMEDYGLDDASSGANRHAKVTACRTCNGDRFVTVRLRSPETTLWMQQHSITANKNEFHEEVAPCPDCHHVEIEWWRHDHTRFRVMDPAQVREAIRP